MGPYYDEPFLLLANSTKYELFPYPGQCVPLKLSTIVIE